MTTWPLLLRDCVQTNRKHKSLQPHFLLFGFWFCLKDKAWCRVWQSSEQCTKVSMRVKPCGGKGTGISFCKRNPLYSSLQDENF